MHERQETMATLAKVSGTVAYLDFLNFNPSKKRMCLLGGHVEGFIITSLNNKVLLLTAAFLRYLVEIDNV